MGLAMRVLLILLLLLTVSTSWARGKYQFHFDVGQDNPDTGEERTSAATLVKFELVNGQEVWRIGSAFIYAMGSQQFSQGEFTIGPYIYPLARTSRSPIQPAIYAVGKVGFGTFADKSRTDTGYGLGAAVDIYMFKSSGIKIAVEQHSATESATRLWLGIHWN